MGRYLHFIMLVVIVAVLQSTACTTAEQRVRGGEESDIEPDIDPVDTDADPGVDTSDNTAGDADGDADADSDVDNDTDVDSDSDNDADADADGDADSDSDADADGDSDGDGDTGGSPSGSGFRLYFVRHAETVANVTGNWDDGGDKIFSDDGVDQVAALTERLSQISDDVGGFDAVISSMKWRAMNTVLPHLKSKGMKGELWPELSECCWQDDCTDAPLDESAIDFSEEESVAEELMDECSDCADDFTIRSDAERTWPNDTCAKGKAQVIEAADILLDTFGDRDVNVLMAGHYYTGRRILNQLVYGDQDEDSDVEPSNAKISLVVQDADGSFDFVYMDQ